MRPPFFLTRLQTDITVSLYHHPKGSRGPWGGWEAQQSLRSTPDFVPAARASLAHLYQAPYNVVSVKTEENWEG